MTIRAQSAIFPRNLAVLCVALFVLSACGGSDTIDLTTNKNVGDAIEAATGPLQDLNLRQQEIPALLVTAMKNPYARAKKLKCADLQSEVSALDALLGPDMEPSNITLASANTGLAEHISSLSEAEMPTTMSLVESAGGLAKDVALSSIRSHTNILPFRSIIRSLSGASRHQKKLESAYQAGKLRRAYLKGLADVRFGERCPLGNVVLEATAQTTQAQ